MIASLLSLAPGTHFSIEQLPQNREGSLLLRVIVKEDVFAYHVVTAYKTSNVAKYWRTP